MGTSPHTHSPATVPGQEPAEEGACLCGSASRSRGVLAARQVKAGKKDAAGARCCCWWWCVCVVWLTLVAAAKAAGEPPVPLNELGDKK